MNSGINRKRAIAVASFLFLLCLGIFTASWSTAEPALKISFKRYGRTMEGQSVAWLIVTNTSSARVYLLGDHNPVTTAFCEYRQRLPAGVQKWRYHPPSTSGRLHLRQGQQTSLRILLPTNGIPVSVSLLVNVEYNSPLGNALRPVRHWLWRTGLLSPVKTIPVPFELIGTNVVTKFVE